MSRKARNAAVERKRSLIVEGDPQKIFPIFDRNHDGTISAGEIYKAFKRMKFDITETEIRDIMQAFDADGNDTIDFEEFKYFTKKFLKIHNEKPFEYIFQYFDSDHDGELTLEEFMSTLITIGRDDVSRSEAEELIGPHYNKHKRITLEGFGKAFNHLVAS